MAGIADSGREPVQIIEIDQDFCELEYGVAPCTAALGVTGTRKCYNTRKTCQDPANYDPEPLILRFARSAARLPDDLPSIPTVQSVSTSPTRLNIGSGDRGAGPLGRRASVQVGFADAPYSDLLTDKYLTDRDFDPLERGTFWSKFLARNYYSGRPLRVIEGYYQDPIPLLWGSSPVVWGPFEARWNTPGLTDQRTRNYIIERITGPDAQARVTVVAKDVLKQVDDRRTTAPRVCEGVLTAALSDSETTSFSVSGEVLDRYSATGGTVRIGDECIGYASASISNDIITFSTLTRGTDGTEAEEHDQGDQVQETYRVTNKTPYEAIAELLTDFGNIPPAFVDLATWEAENNLWLVLFDLSTLITEPTGVNQLIGEICEQVGASVWWDEREQTIRFQAVRPPLGVIPDIDGNNILANTLSSITRDDERLTQAWVYILQRNPTEAVDDTGNYRRIRIRVDSDAESESEFGDQRIKRVFARWLQGDGQAADISSRLLSNYREIPTVLSFELDAKDSDLWTGDLLTITFRTVTDDTGQAEPQIYQIISAQEREHGHAYRYEAQRYRFEAFRTGLYTGPLNAVPQPPDYADADEQTRLENGYYANEDGLIPDGADFDPAYTYI